MAIKYASVNEILCWGVIVCEYVFAGKRHSYRSDSETIVFDCFIPLVKRIYNSGRTINVSTVAVNRPPITTVANGFALLHQPPKI